MSNNCPQQTVKETQRACTLCNNEKDSGCDEEGCNVPICKDCRLKNQDIHSEWYCEEHE